jgi:uncharacterized membrane protein
MKPVRVLFAGETCMVHTMEMKGFDSFTSTRFAEAFVVMHKVFKQVGVDVTHIPCHRVPAEFPNTLEGLAQYDVVLFSDVGSNTFLLHPDTTRFCKRTPNLLKLVRQYVENGGGFGMIGGWMTFQGIEAKGKYKDTPIEEILPVNLLPYDDRTETPEGVDLRASLPGHPILNGIPKEMPFILGYNRTIAKPTADVLVANGSDPVIAAWSYGKGRTLAYTTDCAPHWAPPAMYEWEQYPALWKNITDWLASRI